MDKNIDLNLDLFVVVKSIENVMIICREILWISNAAIDITLKYNSWIKVVQKVAKCKH
jgi:hypothetical protein